MATASIAFVSPRFAEGPTVGGAETLLKAQACRAAKAGLKVSFLTTCARDHFSWANELPPGTRRIDGVDVTFFPVDEDRDVPTFLAAQSRISSGLKVDADEELAWIRNSVNSTALCDHVREQLDTYDRIVPGPYLFGLVYQVCTIAPEKTVLVPCLHDEAFAYLEAFRTVYSRVGGFMFNSVPERELAQRLLGIPADRGTVVGVGLDPFTIDSASFARRRGIGKPYILYSGRREGLKGTPLLLDYFAAFRRRTGRDVKLVLTGSGEIDVAAEVREHVIDVGFVSEDEKHEAMAGAVAFCQPSLYESLGIVLLEAWLAGTPVLVRSQSAVLQQQCAAARGGLWFRTYPEFEEELILLLDEPDTASALARQGREYVLREFRWDAVEARLLTALGAAG